MTYRQWLSLSVVIAGTVLFGAACSNAAQKDARPPMSHVTASRLSASYVPPATYYGDGATNDGAGRWTTSSAGSHQCLSCHNRNGGGLGAPDMTGYLETGHKNVLRKIAPGKIWAGADGTLESLYFSTDSPPPAGNSLYGSGSTFDWVNGIITVGSGPSAVGELAYAPGSRLSLFYEFGGWSDPTALDTIFRGGFTGEQWPAGNYDCARCHTTGYRWDDNGIEPSFAVDLCSDGVSATQPDCQAAGATWNVAGSKISATDFSRIPTDFACSDGVSASYQACLAKGDTAATASWMLDGVQCERCHQAQAGHTQTGDRTLVTTPTAESATALCMQCHREENVDTASHQFTFGACSDASPSDYATCIASSGNAWMTDLIVYDGGSCSDASSPDYFTCAGAGATWTYAPFFDHESGPTFLNSPHARFAGSLSVANQDSTDMTLTFTGSYHSAFQDQTGANAGCTGCHDPHQSLVSAVGAAPFVRQCVDCHVAYANVGASSRHPSGAGTPFDTGGDVNASCAICHMSQSYHLFRISTDPSYSTFPTAAQIAAGGGQGLPNGVSDGTLANAVWSDLDLACGQCHVGSGAYGLATPSGVGSMSKQSLSFAARCMHQQPVIHTSAGSHGSISPPGTVFLSSGASQTFTFTPDPGYAVQSITVDGNTIAGMCPPTRYTFTNVVGCHQLAVQFAPAPTTTYSLTVAMQGAPGGTVSGVPFSPACVPTTTTPCTGALLACTPVTLTGSKDSTAIVVGWRGCDSVTSDQTTCTVTMTAAKAVTAIFQPASYTLTGKTAGAGSGSVTLPNAVTCSAPNGTCSTSVANGSVATVVATPADANSIVTGWTGCSTVSPDKSTCTTPDMTGPLTVTATFQPANEPLAVALSGTVTGTVTSPQPPIACSASGGACSGTAPYGSTVALTGSKDSTAIVVGWRGCDSVTSDQTTCTVNMTLARLVTAIFGVPVAGP